MAKYNTQDRRDLAKKGHALPDGSFPIADEEDLHSAVRNWNFGKQPQVAKNFIIKRAKAMGMYEKLPDKWKALSMQHYDAEAVDDFLMHVGVKGMRWGHRKAPEPLVGRQRASGPPTKAVVRKQVEGGKSYLKKKYKLSQDQIILKARKDAEKTTANFKAAQGKGYRANKQKFGKAKAKQILKNAQYKQIINSYNANLETSKERADRIMQTIGSATANAAFNIAEQNVQPAWINR